MQMKNIDFPSTIWSSLIVSVENKAIAEEFLIENYWKPILHFIKCWNPPEDPCDLTQEFLMQCLEKDFISRLSKQEKKGSFRSYLKKSLRYFLLNRQEWCKAQKRVHDFSHLPFEEAMTTSLPKNKSPDEIFNYTWAKDVMKACYKILRKNLREKNKEVQFFVFHDFYVTQSANYKELMVKYNITHDETKNYLQRTKGKLQDVIEKKLSESVTSKEELEEELFTLKNILG